MNIRRVMLDVPLENMENQEEKLKREILAESQKKADRIVARAQRDADTALAKAEKENAAHREARLEDVKVEAVRRVRKIELDAGYDLQRSWLSSREKCIDDMLARVLKSAENLDDESLKKSYAALVNEAMGILDDASEAIVVRVNERGAAFVTPEWLAQIAPGRSFTVECRREMPDGLLFSTPDERLTLDDTFANRMAVMKDDFRNLMAECALK